MKFRFLLLFVFLLLVLSSLLTTSPTIRSSFAASESKLAKQSVAPINGAGSENLWQDVDAKLQSNFRIRQQHGPSVYRAMRLATQSLRALLSKAPRETRNAPVAKDVSLSLPLPDGGFMRFNIEDSPIMDGSLAERYPEI